MANGRHRRLSARVGSAVILFLFLAFCLGYVWFRASARVETIISQNVARFESESRVAEIVDKYRTG